jgi:microcystin-dependent protein
VYSSIFKSDPNDRAKEDVTGAVLAETNGHVTLATDAQAKANQAKKTDRAIVAQSSQLPSVDSIETLEISSIEGNGYSDTPLEVEKSAITTRSEYLIKFKASFNTWLSTITSRIDTLMAQMVNVQSQTDTNTTNIANLTPVGVASSIPVGGVIQWFSNAGRPDDFLPLRGQQNISQTTYATLYAVLGNQYSVSADPGDFGLPNMSGKYPIGTYDIDDVGNKLGDNSPWIQKKHIPAHTHSVNITTSSEGSHTHNIQTNLVSGEPSSFYRSDYRLVDPTGTVLTTSAIAAAGDHTHTVSGNTGDVDNPGTRETWDNRPASVEIEYLIRAI